MKTLRIIIGLLLILIFLGTAFREFPYSLPFGGLGILFGLLLVGLGNLV